MYKFSKISLERLYTCDERLQRLFNEVIKEFDCSVLCGHRGREEQDKAFEEGKSKLKYPYGKHNKTPSMAVDVTPYPIDWDNTKKLYAFGEYVKFISNKLDIKIRWGGDWDGDGDYKDQKLNDLDHFELIE